MALYAIDDLDDAWIATREFLTPLSIRRLLVLSVIVLFAGGAGTNVPGSGAGSAPAGTDTGPGPAGPGLDVVRQFVVENALAIGLVGAALLAVALAFAFAGALMEFVFVESLRTDEVRFVDYSRRFLGEGAALFGFRIVLTLIAVLPALGLVGFGLATVGSGSIGGLEGVVLVALAVLAVCAGVSMAIVDAATTAFVVPVMLVRDRGVREAWRAFWPTLIGEWKQYLAYGLGALVLNVAMGVLAAVLLAIVAVVFLVPLAVVVGATALLAPNPVIAVVAVVIGTPFLLALLIAALVVQVPIRTYLRYYALLVLGDTDPSLDPIPEIRATVRDDRGNAGDRPRIR